MNNWSPSVWIEGLGLLAALLSALVGMIFWMSALYWQTRGTKFEVKILGETVKESTERIEDQIKQIAAEKKDDHSRLWGAIATHERDLHDVDRRVIKLEEHRRRPATEGEKP